MSVRDLEIELGRLRDPGRRSEGSNALRIETGEALAFRESGNLPDDLDRTLRLVLAVGDEPLEVRRLRYEPDFHAAPSWKREGSRTVNVVPLLQGSPTTDGPGLPWWEQPDMAPLEAEWQRTGIVGSLPVPAAYRGFVFKTIVALRSAGIEVTQASVIDSVSRWLSESQVEELRRGFQR